MRLSDLCRAAGLRPFAVSRELFGKPDKLRKAGPYVMSGETLERFCELTGASPEEVKRAARLQAALAYTKTGGAGWRMHSFAKTMMAHGYSLAQLSQRCGIDRSSLSRACRNGLTESSAWHLSMAGGVKMDLLRPFVTKRTNRDQFAVVTHLSESRRLTALAGARGVTMVELAQAIGSKPYCIRFAKVAELSEEVGDGGKPAKHVKLHPSDAARIAQALGVTVATVLAFAEVSVSAYERGRTPRSKVPVICKAPMLPVYDTAKVIEEVTPAAPERRRRMGGNKPKKAVPVDGMTMEQFLSLLGEPEPS
jgi:transcriptional regulator with XRE-family HTH domain